DQARKPPLVVALRVLPSWLVRSKELGEFLRSRRERATPSDLGAQRSGRRRAPGLRREEVAASAGVTVSWLARLEQGRANAVSAQVLQALARALRLDATESEHLFALGGLRVDHQETAPTDVTAAMDALLTALDPNPAYVLDRAWNVIAWNRAEEALFPGIAEDGAARNLLELVFGDFGLQTLMADHDEEAARLVSQFRAHRTAWPDDPAIAAVVARLQTASTDFARRWAAHDVAPFATTRRLFDHPLAGRLELDHHRLELLEQPGTMLVLYVDVPGTDSIARLTAVR
ncbi:MAG: helix-turn-helix transcriptional regulator, partial [Acidimicrobiales bacterium]